ncbi:ABC transporter ATP-binding protein [Paraglaciecola polaris]|uniref:Fe(3+) ions import ATP-binding protein FbpC n=1 Tax=Paraglaciecola polaris LMG 21857 TaxID=1129793 RepID=K6ZMD6_9ALTE|nr:ABC transporter ATP-binding protein [Paraglaciecola polaris]GAC31472.1 Fe(3+) ions import ATP-binding protein FbpC [Paraglaciecola polaris LMG 21857]
MLSLSNICVAYDNKPVVNKVSFSIESGEIGCLLGPSGCGKTSILRAIAGFEPVSEGDIHLRGTLVAGADIHAEPERRKVGVVFQDFALFPHLNVGQNIAFGLHGHSALQKSQRVIELLALVGLPDISERFAHSLSGGQQQRVALARALAPRPDLLLLDEPFSSLDAELREELAQDIRRILKHEGTSALLVTHDQHEAFAMADAIGVLKGGQLLQWASAYQLYHRPADKFVAGFIGQGTLLPGTLIDNSMLQTELGLFQLTAPQVTQFAGAKILDVLVRPDDIVHDDSSTNVAMVLSRAFKGAHILYELALNDDPAFRVLCLAPSHHDHELGERIGIRLDLKHLVMFNA